MGTPASRGFVTLSARGIGGNLVFAFGLIVMLSSNVREAEMGPFSSFSRYQVRGSSGGNALVQLCPRGKKYSSSPLSPSLIKLLHNGRRGRDTGSSGHGRPRSWWPYPRFFTSASFDWRNPASWCQLTVAAFYSVSTLFYWLTAVLQS